MIWKVRVAPTSLNPSSLFVLLILILSFVVPPPPPPTQKEASYFLHICFDVALVVVVVVGLMQLGLVRIAVL